MHDERRQRETTSVRLLTICNGISRLGFFNFDAVGLNLHKPPRCHFLAAVEEPGYRIFKKTFSILIPEA